MPKAISRLSALCQIRLWIDTHQRGPTADECVPQNGLPHYSTLRFAFSGLGTSLRLAYQLSATDIAQWQAEALKATTKTRRCLVCERSIPCRGDIWRCDTCRKQCQGMTDDPPALDAGLKRRLGLDEEE